MKFFQDIKRRWRLCPGVHAYFYTLPCVVLITLVAHHWDNDLAQAIMAFGCIIGLWNVLFVLSSLLSLYTEVPDLEDQSDCTCDHHDEPKE